jgi:hypothetical protein
VYRQLAALVLVIGAFAGLGSTALAAGPHSAARVTVAGQMREAENAYGGTCTSFCTDSGNKACVHDCWGGGDTNCVYDCWGTGNSGCQHDCSAPGDSSCQYNCDESPPPECGGGSLPPCDTPQAPKALDLPLVGVLVVVGYGWLQRRRRLIARSRPRLDS